MATEINTTELEAALKEDTGRAFDDYWTQHSQELNRDDTVTFTGGEVVKEINALIDRHRRMTLLDKFAKAALIGMLAEDGSNYKYATLAAASYECAVACMAERERRMPHAG